MNESKQYVLHIDGKLFRAQRELLLKIADLVRRKQPYKPSLGDGELLEGLLNLTDAICGSGPRPVRHRLPAERMRRSGKSFYTSGPHDDDPVSVDSRSGVR